MGTLADNEKEKQRLNTPATGENPLVMVVGEHLDTGVHVVEAFLEELSRATGRLILLLARRERAPRRSADDPAPREYDYFVSLARKLGIAAEVKFLRSRDPYTAVLAECEAYAAAHPDAVFCFIEWGSGEGGLEKALVAKHLKTASLFELVGRKAGRG